MVFNPESIEYDKKFHRPTPGAAGTDKVNDIGLEVYFGENKLPLKDYDVKYSRGEQDMQVAGPIEVTITGKAPNCEGELKGTFTIEQKALPVKGIKAENKPYDGNNKIKITDIALDVTDNDGKIEEGDTVRIQTGGIVASVASEKAGRYDELVLEEIPLSNPNYKVQTPLTVHMDEVVEIYKKATPTPIIKKPVSYK